MDTVVQPADPTEPAPTFHFAYDGSSRLVEVERVDRRSSAWTLLDYDVDDQVVREHRTDGDFHIEEIYRFEGWRHDAVSGERIEAVLLMMKIVRLNGRTQARRTLTEPDGHTLATYSPSGTELTFEVAGAYGRALPDVLKLPYKTGHFASAATWPVESVHGLEQDRHLGLVHAGARHFVARDGMWMQPEPLLHLGLWNADPGQPVALGGVYAGGDPVGMADRDGYYFEIAWDLANVAMGLASLGSNLAEGNYGAAAVDAVGVAADIAGAAVPVVPSGAGTAIRASRAADKAGALAKGAGASKAGTNSVGGVGQVGNLPKPPRGPGSVPKDQRDPQRLFTPDERAAKREAQGGKCATGCGTDIDASNSRGHHVERHADGGPTTSENHAEVCVDCHLDLHSKD